MVHSNAFYDHGKSTKIQLVTSQIRQCGDYLVIVYYLSLFVVTVLLNEANVFCIY